MAKACAGLLSAEAVALELGVSVSRYYQLRTDYLLAWTAEVTALITKLLSSKPPCSYSAAASEAHRRLNFKTDRASIRRWAIEHHLAPDTRYKATPKPVKRGQARDDGALWQYDATPHAWLPGGADKQVLLEILDDATRLNKRPARKNDPSSGPIPTVRGGPTSGASKPASASVTTAKSPSAPNASPLTLHPAPPSSAASVQMETFTTSARLPIPKSNPSSYSIARCSETIPVLFAHSFPTLFATRH